MSVFLKTDGNYWRVLNRGQWHDLWLPCWECCGLRAHVEGPCREIFQQSNQEVVETWTTITVKEV